MPLFTLEELNLLNEQEFDEAMELLEASTDLDDQLVVLNVDHIVNEIGTFDLDVYRRI